MATPTTISGTRPQVRTAVTVSLQDVPVIALDWANGQVVAIAGTSAASAIFDATNDRIVEACSSTDCWITIAASPTAAVAAGSTFLAAGSLRYIYVPANGKVAAIQSTAAGSIALIPALIAT